ncbi:hypothetical protein [Paludisphaera mucosa]|uniref:Uncharacterized protein n=1 Tax=Paludisphaera mucosa TaxID=3030827 RepID=A0ABT6F8A6_9BACT|nr:hypothetical protein [Paludisphaera mucosa]MDG3003819.1 hypothetical protein [Paludisphaera mucosa]
MIRAKFREGARGLHGAMGSRTRGSPTADLTLRELAAIENPHSDFDRPIEDRLASFESRDDPEFHLRDHVKLPQLSEDLAALAGEREEVERSPGCGRPPLGGRIIAAHVCDVLPGDEARGCSFFHGYGAEVRPTWSSFPAAPARPCHRCGDSDLVVHPARRTFAALDRWLSHAA